jgi:CubicO group peptidase (beta-lactamase class C family)
MRLVALPVLLGLLALAGRAAAQETGAATSRTRSDSDLPITGTGAALPDFDKAILDHLEKSKCTAATFALSKGGRVGYSRGYGWLDLEKTRPTPADTPMRVASISKPITNAVIHKLIASGKLAEDTQVWPLLKIGPPEGAELDPRWKEITVKQLLQHKGGWDIQQLGFDPMFNGPRAARELKLNRAATPDDMVRWMMSVPLSFNPGEHSAYSNFGYCVLGRLIERVAHRPYVEAVRREVGRPAGIKPQDIWLGQSDVKKRDPREPEYNEPCNVDIMDAHGGIVISSPALCRFLQSYWISGKPRKPNQRGHVYTFYGSMPGTSSISHQRADGVNFAASFNGRHQDASQDELTAEINGLIDKM